MEHGHKVQSVTLYLIVYLVLVALLGLTYAAATVNLGPLNIVIAMAIAIMKAAMVVLIFMNVKFSSRLTWVWAALGFIWLFILFGTFGDYFTRVHITGW